MCSVNIHVSMDKSIKFVNEYTGALVFCCRICQTWNIQGHPVGPHFGMYDVTEYYNVLLCNVK